MGWGGGEVGCVPWLGGLGGDAVEVGDGHSGGGRGVSIGVSV